jgi:hypothetical protein
MTDLLDLTHRASGPDAPPLPDGSPLRSGGPDGRSAMDVLAVVLVGVAFGLCTVVWIVLFCVIAMVA